MKILYAFQGTGNGHVARARDLVPRFAAYGELDVLCAGVQSELDLGYPIKYHRHGLSMVYNSRGSVSYWKSLISYKLFRFVRDIISLPVKQYDLIVIDFEAVTSYACKLRGVKSIQLSHQAAYWSDGAPRPEKREELWEWVMRNMSPSTYALGFHFGPYDSFVLPPIIRKEIRELSPQNTGHITVYLPSYSAAYLVEYLSQFPQYSFRVFSKEAESYNSDNVNVKKADVNEFLKSFSMCAGIICGAGFEAPAEALYLGKKVLVIPIAGQYEQQANAAAAREMGVASVSVLNAESAREINRWLAEENGQKIDWPDYAGLLVERIVDNCRKNLAWDQIEGLDIW